MLENKQGLIAGDGTLPVKMAQYGNAGKEYNAGKIAFVT